MLITLTTDFGQQDSFVGAMKGVILSKAPQARIVDLAHGISAGDVRGGAFALMTAAPYFPTGTIHVVVIDPGVGSARQAVAIRARGAIFLGPDNGVLSWALKDEESPEVRSVENSEISLPRVSATFHGRDLFAPAAAWLAQDREFATLGPPLATFQRLAWPTSSRVVEGWKTEIIHIDIYGNAITSFPEEQAANLRSAVLPGGVNAPFQPSYSAVPAGSPLAIVGSSGFVEIAINQGNAAQALRLKPGTAVILTM